MCLNEENEIFFENTFTNEGINSYITTLRRDYQYHENFIDIKYAAK